VPYRKQLDEFRRALRLKSIDEARHLGPVYDGYEVQRRVSRFIDGKEVVEVDWPKGAMELKPNYDFEARYGELINARKLEDNIEDSVLLQFMRYDMALALPFPKLVEELGKYPDIRLPNILETIKKLRDAAREPEKESDLLNRIRGTQGKQGLYTPQTGQDTGASGVFGEAGGLGTGMGLGGKPMAPGSGGLSPPPGPGRPGAPGGDMGGDVIAPPVEVEHFLLRFIDVDVKPGYTYEYRIRLKMKNPNLGQEKLVSNPAYAKEKILYSPWTQLAGSFTIPTEEFTYAVDPATYRSKIEKEYSEGKDRELRERLQVKDNQAVIEICRWLEEVSIGSGTREPVGSWVVANIPTGRGELIGRKQYVKLPLWSAKINQYALREVTEKIIPRKDATQPKGWLVDFTTRNILVDFDGGKVKTKSRKGEVAVDDASTEMLILRPDGQLEVKKSAEDENNPERKKYLTDWDTWVKKVEARKSDGKDDGGFERGPGTPGKPGKP
ncbi:MAG TPA: hypothetical protein VLM40_13795, partial [Gemmata sp.]|nr:hypothetical protein [Gemmata sp.]